LGTAVGNFLGLRDVHAGPGRPCQPRHIGTIYPQHQLLQTAGTIKIAGTIKMVKRAKHEDLAGVLEFEGRTAEDPEFIKWLTEHRARKGGKIRVARGSKGVRVMFGNAADLAWWKARSEQAPKVHKAAA
jgi:hypothetical protein